jgi:hypothetical protein
MPTHDTTKMGTVLPKVQKTDTAPIPVKTVGQLLQVYINPCYTLIKLNKIINKFIITPNL